MIKRLLLSLCMVLFLCSSAFSAVTGRVVVFSGDANPVTTVAGNSFAYGGDQTYSAITCFVVGTSGDLNLDIDGSLDGITYFGLQDDITATGGYSIINQPFNYYLLDVDACSTCSVTTTCQTKPVN